VKTLKDYLERIIEPAAIEHKIDFYKRHDAKPDIYFWENVESLLEGYADRLCREANMEFNDPRFDTRRSFEFAHPDIMKMKKVMDVIYELKEELTYANGEMTYDKKFSDTDDWTHWYIQKLKANLEGNGEWILQQNLAHANYWEWNEGIRKYTTRMVYKLLHNDGTEMIFELPFTEDDSIHALFFKRIPSQQNGYFEMRKRFAFCFDTLVVQTGHRSLVSPCLVEPTPEAPVRAVNVPHRPSSCDLEGKQDDNAHENENVIKRKREDCWRFEKTNLGDGDEDGWKLMKMWLRLGMCRPKLPDQSKHYLHLFHPEKVLEAKNVYLKEHKVNLFRHIGKSVYDRDLERELRT
jgi:hypothetical protein